VIGALARSDLDPREGFVVMTSRASYELVQKAAVAGIPMLAAVSRPTGLAIRLANAAGLTLIGLLRGRTANVYAHAERVLHQPAE
jgi:FdhD protein